LLNRVKERDANALLSLLDLQPQDRWSTKLAQPSWSVMDPDIEPIMDGTALERSPVKADRASWIVK
jgi:hypothetical protein